MKNCINFKYIMNMFINLKNISYKLWAICIIHKVYEQFHKIGIIHKIYEQFHKIQKYFKYIMNKFLNQVNFFI